MFRVPTLDYFGSCVAHLLDGFFTVAWLQFNRPHGVFDGFNFESVFHGVDDRVLHTVIRGEPADNELVDVLTLELLGEIGFVES